MATTNKKSGKAQEPQVFGLTRKQENRIMLKAEAEYEEWRKGGFKAAWWWRHFKGQDA